MAEKIYSINLAIGLQMQADGTLEGTTKDRIYIVGDLGPKFDDNDLNIILDDGRRYFVWDLCDDKDVVRHFSRVV